MHFNLHFTEVEWRYFCKFSIYQSFHVDILDQLDDFQPYLPTIEEDLYGSITAIYLLQDTYNISAHDMASGNIPGKLK